MSARIGFHCSQEKLPKMAQPVSVNVSSGGNLALAYQETLTSIVRLRSGRQTVTDSQSFREQFLQALRQAHEEARTRGYTDEENREARFAVVAFLDETVLNLRSPALSDWVRKPLQEELFGVHVGGEVFFQNLERLMRQPDSVRLADVIEVYLTCLSLGYAGRYSVSGRGELATLRQNVFARIQRVRGPAGELSPAWMPAAEAKLATGKDPWLRPLLWTAVACLIIAVGLFVFYKLSLQSGVASVAALGGSGVTR
jgi:type VI secretion system protein ImpK